MIAQDGSIPAETLAQHGLRPGSHLRVIPDLSESQPPRKKLKGALVGKLDVEAFEQGMEWGEADRISRVADDGQS